MSRRSHLIWRRFARRRPALVGLGVLLTLLIGSFVVPLVLSHSYIDIDTAAILQPPSLSHPFGTGAVGEDVLAQSMRGLQKSLVIGLTVALLSTAIAATVGSIAGYLGGLTDRALMWLVDLLLVIPAFLLVAIFAPRVKAHDSIPLLIGLLTIFGWMISARMVRGMTLTLRDQEFVRAARYMGATTRQVITRHVLPNIASILIIDTTLNVGASILAESGLSFLGFGVQPPDVSLGTLIATGTGSALTFPWLFVFPGFLLIATVLAVNVIGDGLRDALDPSAKAVRRAAADDPVAKPAALKPPEETRP